MALNSPIVVSFGTDGKYIFSPISFSAIISVVILEKKETSLFINTWLMSCRVLKRTVEEFIISKIIETAKNNGFDKVIGEYIPTPKNSMVKDIYEKMGFNRISENKFEALVDSFKYKTCFIKEDK